MICGEYVIDNDNYISCSTREVNKIVHKSMFNLR